MTNTTMNDVTPQIAPDSDNRPFPTLPVELIREIFEIAALSSIRTARDLTLVSRLAREWVDPCLFRTIVITTPLQAKRFARTLTYKPSSFFASGHVRNVCFTAGLQALEACELILRAVAKGVRNLSIHGGISNPNVYGNSALHAMRPYRVTIQQFVGHAHFEPLFSNVTHLRICNFYPVFIQIRSLAKSCPLLTHLAFMVSESEDEGDEVGDLLRDLLSEAKMLEMVVVEVKRPPGGSKGFESDVWRIGGVKDTRVRVIESSVIYLGIQGWEEETRGGENLWEKAHRIGSILDSLPDV